MHLFCQAQAKLHAGPLPFSVVHVSAMVTIRFAALIEDSSVLGAFALESTLYSTETASMLSSSTAKACGPGQAILSMHLLLHHSTDA